jgi:hypothetical protein
MRRLVLLIACVSFPAGQDLKRTELPGERHHGLPTEAARRVIGTGQATKPSNVDVPAATTPSRPGPLTQGGRFELEGFRYGLDPLRKKSSRRANHKRLRETLKIATESSHRSY